MRKIGYIRVNSDGQNSAWQQEQLSQLKLDTICKEVISGASMDRKGLQPGDTAYVTDLT